MSKLQPRSDDSQRIAGLPCQDVHQVLANRITHATVRRSVTHLLDNPGTPVRISDLVVASGMSRRGFHKAFTQQMGCSPGRFLRGLRIQRAKELLKLGMKIKVVAGECGFRKLNTFEIAFKKAAGLAPGQFSKHENRRFNGRKRSAHLHSVQISNGFGNGRSRGLFKSRPRGRTARQLVLKSNSNPK
jgi:transcriptional regulator GlxA family with amidase domain